MGTLVNPIGWRLRSNIYWKINFVALDQNNFMQNSNNYLAYYKIIEGVLNRLNKMFNASNYIRFSGHKIFVQQTTAFLLVRMRISRDTEIRRKAGRSFKYLRKEVASENKIKFSFSGWVLRTR
ncbi:MAG TPA: hypothetical protein PKD85_00115 [Saprospiraceae bacterium]|nr:hypothetical protein [Saprospiraceae bacterium]